MTHGKELAEPFSRCGRNVWPMPYRQRSICFAKLTLLATLVLAECAAAGAARAQSPPPLTIPAGGPPANDPTAVVVNGWLLRGSLDTAVQYSNNYLLTTPPSISGWAVGVGPHLSAEWSDGIFGTSLYGDYDHFEYRMARTDDGDATIRETYSPLRGLTFSLTGDYAHQTFASTLTSSMPTGIATRSASTSTVLPNGNTVLPNGTIVTPGGQIVGQVSQAGSVGTISAVNPYDQYTITAKSEDIFDGGVFSVGASLLRSSYEEPSSTTLDYTAETVNEDAAFWVGPLFYLYTDGSFAARKNTNPFPNSSAYRVISGVGTREFDLLRGSIYVGYQGSEAAGSGSAGGLAYGGAVSYDPIPNWSLSANYDRTINISNETSTLSQALSLPGASPTLVPLGSSTDVSSFTVRSEYRPTPQWTLIGVGGLTSIRYLDSPQRADAWLADVSLQYEMWRNLILAWEVQYSSFLSNTPGADANRKLAVMRTSYKF